MKVLLLLLFAIPTFAQLPTSGSLALKNAAGAGRSISQQVDGNETGNKSLTTLSVTASKTAPHSMLEFYGYGAGSTFGNSFFVGAAAAFSGTLQLYYSTNGTTFTPLGTPFTGTSCNLRGTLDLSSSFTTIYIRIYSSATGSYIPFMFNTVTDAGESCIDSEALVTTASFTHASGSRYMYVHSPPPTCSVAPLTPASISMTGGGPSSTVNVSWVANGSGDPATRYTIERFRVSTGIWTPLTTIPGTSFVDTGLVTDEYFYRVRAENTCGNSGYRTSGSIIVN